MQHVEDGCLRNTSSSSGWSVWKWKSLPFFLCLSSSNHQLEFWFFFFFFEKGDVRWFSRGAASSPPRLRVGPRNQLPSDSCRCCLEGARCRWMARVHGELSRWERFSRRVFVLWRTSSELAPSADARVSREWAEVRRSQTLNRSWARLEGPSVGDRREPVG